MLNRIATIATVSPIPSRKSMSSTRSSTVRSLGLHPGSGLLVGSSMSTPSQAAGLGQPLRCARILLRLVLCDSDGSVFSSLR